MKIQVIGSGCATCRKLFELTKEAVKQLDLKVDVEYIADVSKLIEMGVMTSPILTIDDKVAMVGFVPNIEKIKKLIASAGQGSGCACENDCGDDCDCKNEETKCSCGGKC